MPSRRVTGLARRTAALAVACLLVAGVAWPGDRTPGPDYVSRLEAVYGPPSEGGFGAAVFHEVLRPGEALPAAALASYRRFVGPLWDRYGEQAWMGPWREVYSRARDARPDIVAELRAVEDRDAKSSVALLLDATEDATAARAALAAAFDAPAVTEVRVFSLGDGAAMSGLLVAGRRGASGDAVFVVVLMD